MGVASESDLTHLCWAVPELTTHSRHDDVIYISEHNRIHFVLLP